MLQDLTGWYDGTHIMIDKTFFRFALGLVAIIATGMIILYATGYFDIKPKGVDSFEVK